MKMKPGTAGERPAEKTAKHHGNGVCKALPDAGV